MCDLVPHSDPLLVFQPVGTRSAMLLRSHFHIAPMKWLKHLSVGQGIIVVASLSVLFSHNVKLPQYAVSLNIILYCASAASDNISVEDQLGNYALHFSLAHSN